MRFFIVKLRGGMKYTPLEGVCNRVLIMYGRLDTLRKICQTYSTDFQVQKF